MKALTAVVGVIIFGFVGAFLGAAPFAWVLMLTFGGIHDQLRWSWVHPISFWLAFGISYTILIILGSFKIKIETDQN